MTTRLQSRGIALGRIGLGTAPFGNLYREVGDDVAAEAVVTAFEGGIRYFDTAPHYGLGLSERRLGRALQQLPRDEVVVSSKVGRLLRPNPDARGRDSDLFEVPDDLVRVWDFSAAGVRRSVEESLERMGLDRIDIVYLHDCDDHLEQALTEGGPELSRMRDEGLVRAWGAGMNQAPALARIARETDADVMMMAGRHTLLRQEGDELFEACDETGVTVVAVGVFNSGVLAVEEPGPDTHFDYAPVTPDVLERARAIAAVCREYGTTLPAAAIAFPLRERWVTAVALGVEDAGQVRDNLALAAQDVPEALFEELDARGLVAGSRR
ncbi:aldo/keto reductase [Desertihabitans aurantiacus]|uniref:aldo/keto reductase n=1 Tax=Desertihabitans aurantiacus TaxID=2282477 RepID=UPI000DF77A0D|nr:aldo/keto reductase [Desertihabitans aurantiacus]